MSLKLNSSGGGSVTLQEPTTASDVTLSLPAETGTVVYENASGNVGIGTSSPSCKADVAGAIRTTSIGAPASGAGLELSYGGTANTADILAYDRTGAAFKNMELRCSNLIFNTGGGGERARIDSSGNLTVGATSMPETARVGISSTSASAVPLVVQQTAAGSTTQNSVVFYRNTTTTGTIQVTGTTTAYNTSSDYRLKENVQPMTGALAKVAALKPVTYTWKLDGSAGEGFIAHELAEVVPQAVGGEKDAVNEDGSIKPQGIDTSFLVATLTAAFQEQQQMIETLQAKVAALEAQ